MKFRPYLVLVRAGTLFSPGADVLAGACIVAGARGDLTTAVWDGDLARMIGASVLLYAAGMILNDHADRKLDAMQRPERPIPKGEIAAGTALVMGLLCVVGSLLLSPVPLYHGIMAALVLGYDYLIKASSWAGALVMGTLRGMNLLVPYAAARAAVDPAPNLRAVIEPAVGYGLYIVCVTLLGILEDARKVERKAVLGLLCIPPLAVVLVLLGMPERWPAAGIAMALAAVFLNRHRNVEWEQKTIRGAMMWLLLGTMLYTSLLALGNGRWIESLVILALLGIARVVARRIALT